MNNIVDIRAKSLELSIVVMGLVLSIDPSSSDANEMGGALYSMADAFANYIQTGKHPNK